MRIIAIAPRVSGSKIRFPVRPRGPPRNGFESRQLSMLVIETVPRPRVDVIWDRSTLGCSVRGRFHANARLALSWSPQLRSKTPARDPRHHIFGWPDPASDLVRRN